MKLNKTKIKEAAQDDLIHFAGTAFYSFNDEKESEMETVEEAAEFRKQLDIQYKRIQKLFGYEPLGYHG